MPSDPIKAFPFLFYLQITSETHRRVKREREREKGGLTNADTDVAARSSPNPRCSGKIEPQPQTQRRDRAVEFVAPSSQFASFSFSTQSSSGLLLPISFSFSTQSSSVPPISSSRSHRTNDLVVSISSRSHRRLSFPEVFDHSFFLLLSV